MDGEDQLELLQVGFDRRLHIGILQLAGELGAVMRKPAMHLPKRSGGGGMVLEAGEFLLPLRPELSRHAPLDEGPAHRRRLALQLHQLGGIFGGQRIRNGGHELRHLHDRPFEAAKRSGKFHRAPAAVEIEAEQPRAGDARRDAAHIGADARIARRAGGEAIGFAVGHENPTFTG